MNFKLKEKEYFIKEKGTHEKSSSEGKEITYYIKNIEI